MGGNAAAFRNELPDQPLRPGGCAVIVGLLEQPSELLRLSLLASGR